MPPSRKRRAQAALDDEENVSERATPHPPQEQRKQQRRSSEESDNVSDTPSEAEDADSTSEQRMVKGLVRLALASEYSRNPIRRSDISQKVLGSKTRHFKTVFDAAQLALRQTFGMELVELPAREKVTLREKRAAQKSQSQSTSTNTNKAWILCSVLPAEYLDADITGPSRAPSADTEAAYAGLYTTVVSLVALNGGVLAEVKLERYLHRMNADRNTPVDKTDRLLQRMEKHGYLIKIKDTVQGEESIEYMLGPRAKAEIGEKGIANFIRAVYDATEQLSNEGREDLESRLERSLKMASTSAHAVASVESQPSANGAGPASVPKRGRPRRARDSDSD